MIMLEVGEPSKCSVDGLSSVRTRKSRREAESEEEIWRRRKEDEFLYIKVVQPGYDVAGVDNATATSAVAAKKGEMRLIIVCVWPSPRISDGE